MPFGQMALRYAQPASENAAATTSAQHAPPRLYHIPWPDFNLVPARVAHALFLRVHLKKNFVLAFGHLVC